MSWRNQLKPVNGGGGHKVKPGINRAENMRSIAERRTAMERRWELATAKMQLQDQLQACQECERTRIAADLHDSIGSSLSAIKFALEDAIKRIQVDATQVTVEPLTRVASELKTAIDEVRRIAMNLRPSILDDLGIVATIGWYCRELEGCYQHVRVVKQIGAKEKDIPDSLRTTIFRILQEAANNALKHGAADRIEIALHQDDGEIRLAVEDNGKGFDILEVQAEASFDRHFGIASMRQRAQCSSGKLVIKSSPGAGTLISVAWPTTTC